MKAVAQTSREAYHALANTSRQCAAILNAMRPGLIYSRRQVAMLCGLETSTSAARFNALIAAGQVQVCGRIRCGISGKSVEAVTKTARQLELV
jgi:hypothetical protein